LEEERHVLRLQWEGTHRARLSAGCKGPFDAVNDEDHPKVLLTKETTKVLRPDALFVDSGSSHHLERDRASFITYTVLKKPIPIQLGDNSEIFAVGTGTMRKYVKNPAGTDTMHFTCTLHVPKLASSLQLTAIPGVKLEFEGTLCLIKLHGKLICHASFKDGLYALELANTTSSAASSTAYPSVLKAKTLTPTGRHLDILTLHRCLGHLSFADLRKLWASKMVDGMDLGAWDDDVSCESCLSGKTAHKPFPKGERRRASRVLELVHSDICGPLPNSIGGSFYFITFVDDHSAHVEVDFLKKKRDALASFRAWKARVEKKTGQKVGKICTDNAGELTSNEFEVWLAGDGIVHQTTAPYSSHQNDVAECINRTLEEGARANLTEAGFSIGFWADAVAYGATT
jgi:hypothetical protein